MSLKIFKLFKILNPPFNSPFFKGGDRGILICFILSSKKLIRVKENIKIDKSLCINFGDIFYLTNLTLGTSNFKLTPM